MPSANSDRNERSILEWIGLDFVIGIPQINRHDLDSVDP